MFIPLPILIIVSIAFVFLLAKAVRSSRRRDPLMGEQPPRRPIAARRPKSAVVNATLSPQVEAEVRALLAAGRKIDAIKIARDETGLGLRETKELVEALQ
jgi:large subunit ribosomal protein L7/L12